MNFVSIINHLKMLLWRAKSLKVELKGFLFWITLWGKEKEKGGRGRMNTAGTQSKGIPLQY